MRHLAFCLLAIAALPAAALATGPAFTTAETALPAQADAGLTEARQQLVLAVRSNDAGARAALYLPDALGLAPYQPTLIGPAQIEAYHQALAARRPVAHFSMAPREVLELGDTLVETGGFEAGWSLADGETAAEPGNYMLVWKRQADGSLRLAADAWGYERDLPDAAGFRIELPAAVQRPDPAGDGNSPLGQKLAALNEENARGVQTRDVETRVGVYTEDAIFVPFADTPKIGIEVLRPYLTAYTQQGAEVTFDTVDVWNIGFEDLGSHVLEYSKFRVVWRAGEATGTVSGGGIRLWQRQADGSLKIHRQIGTHDYRP